MFFEKYEKNIAKAILFFLQKSVIFVILNEKK